MAASDDDDPRIAQQAARYRAEQAIVDELDARARRAADAEAQASAERHAKAALALANARRAAAAPRVRTKYEGPDPDRANRGNFVSKEELADFQRKYGADKTLRDLLNADRGLKRRGSSPLAGSGRGTAAGMGAADQVVLRPDPYADTSRVMEGVAAKQREMSRPGRDAIENVYPETVLIPATRLGPLAARAAQAVSGAKLLRDHPSITPERRQMLKEMEDYINVLNQADRPARNPAMRAMEERVEPPFKKGGKVKAYAKGGSVKGSGCEQRGLRKCKVY